MVKKLNPYNKLTTEQFRKCGRHYWKCEYLNPYHIIQEREDLRKFRNAVIEFCNAAAKCDEFDKIKGWINILLTRATGTQDNKYFAGEKQDMFGFADYICIDPFDGIIAAQVTSASGHSEHLRKILRNDYAARWVIFAKIELWSWRKSPKVRGGKKLVWKPKTEIITLDMFKVFAQCHTQPTKV